MSSHPAKVETRRPGDAPEPNTPTRQGSDPDAALRGARVRVVDDEAPNRALLRRVLEPLGCHIAEAADGVEALASAARERPDLILLDVMMPRRDGYSVCRKLKSDPRSRLIPVIILTSLDRLGDRIQGMALGADDILTKPYRPVELITRARALLSLKRFTDELEHATQVLASMALVVESRDRYTGDHCRRLGEYAGRIGNMIGLSEDEIRTLRLGGVMHDLGKIAVPDSVLNKPGRLTAAETLAMRSHPIVGADLCGTLRTMEGVLPLIRSHHERLDGSGYPDGLAGSEIPLLVRVISVVDVYDSLATNRSYRAALPHATCMRVLEGEAARGWWDRDIVETLGRCLSAPSRPSRQDRPAAV